MKKAVTSNSGFSLIEIMVVIGVITLILGLTVLDPFSTLEEEKFSNALRDVRHAIKDAKNKSILNGKETLLRLDLDKEIITVEALPINDIEFYNEDKLEERRDYYLDNRGEILSEWPMIEGVDLVGVYRDRNVFENEQVLILFGPDGTGESFRLKVMIPQSKYEIVYEIRGLMGRTQEVPVDDFSKDWDDVSSERNPPVISFEDFFENGLPEGFSTAAEESGKNGTGQ